MLLVGLATHGDQFTGASLTPKGLDQDLKPDWGLILKTLPCTPSPN
jgi:hypothetical protein